MANEIYDIIMRVQGEDRVRQLTEEIQKEEQAILTLVKRLQAMGATQDQVMQYTSGLARSVQNLNQQLQAAQSQVASAGGGMQRLQQGMIQAGYAVDDLQYGFKGIANNIQPLLMGLGIGGGLAGIISIVITGVVQLQQHWDGLMSAFGMGKVKTQAEEMDELAKATTRTVEQTAKLNEYQKLQKAAQSLEGGVPKSESARQAAAVGGINEAGGVDRIAAGIRGARGTGVDGLDPRMPGYSEYVEAKKMADNPEAFRRLQGSANASTLESVESVKARAAAVMNAEKNKNDTASEKTAKDMAAQAVAGQSGGLDALIGEVKKNPGAFPPGALEQLEKAHPKNIRARQIEATMTEEGDSIKKAQEKSRAETDRKNAMMGDNEAVMQRQINSAKAEDERKNRLMSEDGNSQERVLDNVRKEEEKKKREERNKQNRAFGNLGGDEAAQSIADAMLMSGMSPRAVQSQLQRNLGRSLDPETAKEMSQSATQSGMANMAKIREQMMMEAMGPRQITTGYASFKDSVMSSGGVNDLQRKTMEAGQRSAVQLEQITQLLKSRTFATVVR